MTVQTGGKMKKPKATISGVLLGDTLGQLVGQLDEGNPDAKLIVILVGENDIRLAASENLSKAEILGSLYMAIEKR